MFERGKGEGFDQTHTHKEIDKEFVIHNQRAGN